MRTLETTPETNSKLNSDFATIRPASWSIGKNVKGLTTSAQCIKKSGLDFEVEKRPLMINLGGQIIENDGEITGYDGGENIVSKKDFITVRTDQSGLKSILGSVGKDYTILQNKEAFGFFDSLVGEGFAMFDQAGSFNNGSRIYITADLPDHMSIEVAPGDVIRPKLILTHGHNGKHGISVCFTYQRIYCQNTLNMAIKSAAVGNKLTIRHTENMGEKFKTAHQILGISDLYKEAMEELLPTITQRETTNKEWEYIVASAVASKPEHVIAYLKGERDTKKVPFQLVNTIDAIKQYDNLNPTQQNLGNTAWGAYNALTGFFQNIDTVDKLDNGDRLASIIGGRVATSTQKGWDATTLVAEHSTESFLKKFQLN